MLASGAQQPADILATQVGSPRRSHPPCNLCADIVLVYIEVADSARKSGPAASFRASSRGYFTLSELQLQLPGLSSAILAAGHTALSAETDLRSPLRFLSAN